mgnify:CR=1
MAFLTVKEAAAYVSVHPNTFYRLLWTGQVKGFKIGPSKRARWRIDPDDIEEWLETMGRERPVAF